MKNKIVSEEKNKPVLDEQTLGRLLEAAYVLQEHNRELRELELGLDLKREKIEAQDRAHTAPAPPAKARVPQPAVNADYTLTLAQIVATQHQIQIRDLELDNAMSLVTERVMEIARAAGAAIGVLESNKVRYQTSAGLHTLKVGTEVRKEKALCLPCIRDGQVFRCVDVNPEFLVDTEECRRRGIQSIIAVPIFHEGIAAGGLELYYSEPSAFSEQDVHTCQLMAGLVTEALARNEERSWKQSLADERAAVLEAIEKIKPNVPATTEKFPPKQQSFKSAAAAAPGRAYICPQCANTLVSGEQFCGQCGLPRGGAVPAMPPASAATEAFLRDSVANISKTPPEDLDLFSPVTMFPDKYADEAGLSQVDEAFSKSLNADTTESSTAEHDADAHHEAGQNDSSADSLHEELALIEKGHLSKSAEEDGASTALTPSAQGNWNSASSARDFLEQIAGVQQQSALVRFWNTRRGDIYLAVAVLLVACVIRFGIWSNHSVSATGTPATPNATHRKPAPTPDADLSAFDRMLISLGLADAPQPAEDKGNPSIRVWVDLHTALYYCPGADLYGKTSKGKYTNQRDAQLDQFEPAYRKACE